MRARATAERRDRESRLGAGRRLAFGTLLALSASGCATIDDALSIDEVKPWQRGVLAEPGMQLVTDTMDSSVDDHLYFSREASTGGASIQGGGCGCN